MITIGGEVVVEPPSVVGIVALLMSTKSQVLRVIFALRGELMLSPRAWQSVVDVDVVDDVEDEVVEVFFFKLCAQSGDTTDSWFSSRLCARGGVDVEPSPTATREGDDVETCCIHCFSTKTFLRSLSLYQIRFLGVGSLSSNLSTWTKLTILDDEVVKILTMYTIADVDDKFC
jgi:hypothetical protein